MNTSELQTWIQDRLPAQLLAGAPEIAVYDDELVVMLPIASEGVDAAQPDADHREAALRLIARRREETRALRMRLARDLQENVGRPVAWGMRVGDSSALAPWGRQRKTISARP